MWLIFFPLRWCILALFLFLSFEETTRFQSNLVENFKSDRKSCFQGNINGQKKKKLEEHYKKNIGVPIACTQLKGDCSGGAHFSVPLFSPSLSLGWVSRGTCPRTLVFYYFSQGLELKQSLKPRKGLYISGNAQDSMGQAKEGGNNLSAVLQEPPKRPTNVPTANEALFQILWVRLLRSVPADGFGCQWIA